MNDEKALETIDQKTGEIIESTPEEKLLAASEAAKALERVIKLNDRPPLMFNGKRYLEFHHWQVVGAFYGVSTRTLEPQFCEIAGVQGFRAKAEVVNAKTGVILGGAEAYCMRDEPNWKGKPMYALASMAQTRAASKALSNRFRFVAILAGYEGTPSEEVADAGIKTERQVAMPKSKSASSGVPEAVHLPAEVDRGDSASARETKPTSKFFDKLHQLVREKNIDPAKLKIFIKDRFQKDSSKDMIDGEVLLLIGFIEKGLIK